MKKKNVKMCQAIITKIIKKLSCTLNLYRYVSCENPDLGSYNFTFSYFFQNLNDFRCKHSICH